ncbi:hypothetical protein U9M48_032043 [Paspalum notatum var. saurae]|uniref:Uncharacterized protein n=1 Tax=Paspalum notatum var. saurae TaxID=547442 RepID=A0AAQ3X4Z7_PASNO
MAACDVASSGDSGRHSRHHDGERRAESSRCWSTVREERGEENIRQRVPNGESRSAVLDDATKTMCCGSNQQHDDDDDGRGHQRDWPRI